MSQTYSENRNTLKRYIMPGIWEDIDGGVHFSLPDICRECGLPPTEENMQLASQVFTDSIKRLSPAAKIVHRRTAEE
jgi:hypothetical protein